VVGRSETARLTDRETFHAVLSKPENRYLARQLCWVASIKGLDTYILQARASLHFDFLIETVRPRPSPMDLDIVIGALGELAPPEMCNGLVVPIVYLDQMYSFDRETLLKSVPKPEKPIDTKFEAIAEEILERILQMADNAGSTDEHRALNYLSVRCPTIYAETAKAFARNSILSSIEVRRSPLSGTRRIVDVIFSYTNRATDVTEKVFTRVDVTEKFPFLVTKPSPYVEQYGR
jgi:hypothetical protein